MNKAKLKLDEVEVESFEVVGIYGADGTVNANELRTDVGGTCKGQTGLCTGCTPQQCF